MSPSVELHVSLNVVAAALTPIRYDIHLGGHNNKPSLFLFPISIDKYLYSCVLCVMLCEWVCTGVVYIMLPVAVQM